MRVAERGAGGLPGVVKRPSMGPQHESCGKPALGHAQPSELIPSMGPQHESCGKLYGQYLWYLKMFHLQWGRNMRVAERKLPVSRKQWSICLQWGRNMRVAERTHVERVRPGDLPSMGPQHESCGKAAMIRSSMFLWVVLQWGRNMRVAERGSAPGRSAWHLGLQWGRNMRVAESPSAAIDRRSWRFLQWGRNMRVAESGSSDHDAAPHAPSMGPQHESCGKPICSAALAARSAFNGAAT